MPEAAELKLSCEIIKPLVQNNIITQAISTKNGRYASQSPEGLSLFLNNLNCRVFDVQVRGKFMYWTFDNGWYMFCTYGMTGQWSSKQGKHPCFYFEYIDSSGKSAEIFFNDPRHFGTLKFTNNKQELTNKLNSLGWAPLQDYLSDQEKWVTFFERKFHYSDKTIAQSLMDQSLFCGVGNYLKSEILFDLKMSPWRTVSSLSREEILTLMKSCVKIAQNSYDHQGATLQTFKSPYGEEGKYSSQFKVYGKTTDPDGNLIIRETTPDKRTTHWSPAIQK